MPDETTFAQLKNNSDNPAYFWVYYDNTYILSEKIYPGKEKGIDIPYTAQNLHLGIGFCPMNEEIHTCFTILDWYPVDVNWITGIQLELEGSDSEPKIKLTRPAHATLYPVADSGDQIGAHWRLFNNNMSAKFLMQAAYQYSTSTMQGTGTISKDKNGMVNIPYGSPFVTFSFYKIYNNTVTELTSWTPDFNFTAGGQFHAYKLDNGEWYIVYKDHVIYYSGPSREEDAVEESQQEGPSKGADRFLSAKRGGQQ